MVKRIKIAGSIISNDYKSVYDWLELDSTCPRDIETALSEANGDDVIVEINSGGGSVFSGSEIYTKLKSYAGNVVVEIIGLAASAASVITMAGNVVKMTPTGQFMIHNSSTWASGDRHNMESTAGMLLSVDESIASAYVERTGKSKAEILELMNKETWLNAEKALEHGFIDEILFNQPVLMNDAGFLVPENVLNKIKTDKLKIRQLELQNQSLRLELLERGA